MREELFEIIIIIKQVKKFREEKEKIFWNTNRKFKNKYYICYNYIFFEKKILIKNLMMFFHLNVLKKLLNFLLFYNKSKNYIN